MSLQYTDLDLQLHWTQVKYDSLQPVSSEAVNLTLYSVNCHILPVSSEAVNLTLYTVNCHILPVSSEAVNLTLYTVNCHSNAPSLTYDREKTHS
jgi:hypothetical protein